jgi:hypothetical protein
MKHTNKQDRMLVLHKGFRITLKYTSSKQHPTPNPKKKKDKKPKNKHPAPKYLVAL